MASILGYLNQLLPFATPGTPLVQDLVHLGVICGALYFAPHIQEWYRQRRANTVPSNNGLPGNEQHAAPIVGAERHVDNELNNAVQPDGLIAAPDDSEDDEEQGNDGNVNGGGHEPDEGQPGPARVPDMPNTRNVGAKKAKALAKKEQRRAYHEFQRSQGEAQRAKDAEGAAEREAELGAERERRRAKEAALEAKKAKEREQKREQERKAREDDIRKRELVVKIVKHELEGHRVCDLMKVARRVGDDVDVEWVEKIVTAGGIVGRKNDVVTVITGMGWVVKVSEEDMTAVYRKAIEEDAADSDGRVSFETLGRMVEERLLRP
ncbi:hypothetical protein LTR10_002261 [Elasticomyces elasticus]|uniref:Uncharacterized protein n=1 Tax=Elasticomyces elasticus TaxID=574655 RepID=A0AAN7WR45_9PEZI|nr:hypothetical protein LTR10_002261 [Elasticomyces elasticus]KAK4973666.1 hypothetical protein LTR42_005655 [Elasticomyces elasticus]KAK5707776.1 hypothetical protein LTR97_000314 [Elasticomyces elasticus]